MSEDASAGGRRAAVATFITDRMRDLGLSVPEVMKRSGLSENTVRDMTYGKKSHNDSSWIAMSGALEFMPDHLLKILNGEADVNSPAESPIERRLVQIANELAAIGALRNDVDALKSIAYRIDRKIDIVISVQRSLSGGVKSE